MLNAQRNKVSFSAAGPKLWKKHPSKTAAESAAGGILSAT